MTVLLCGTKGFAEKMSENLMAMFPKDSEYNV